MHQYPLEAKGVRCTVTDNLLLLFYTNPQGVKGKVLDLQSDTAVATDLAVQLDTEVRAEVGIFKAWIKSLYCLFIPHVSKGLLKACFLGDPEIKCLVSRAF